jgi:hypothetical protein
VLAEETEEFRERFSARAVAMGTSNPPILPRGRTAVLDINITRWTTEEERENLFDELAEGGQRSLTRALARQDQTGWVRVTGPTGSGRVTAFPSERLRYAREMRNETGERRIILALDRPLSLYETTNRPRWRSHDITIFVIDFDSEGNGVGQLAIGVRMDLDAETDTLTIENFGTEPVRLTNVRVEE